MTSPSFSVIIPTFNRAHTINRSCESVLKQTFVDFELIIVDDGSTDNTRELLATQKDSRIQYVYQENQGRSAARNAGVRSSHGENIAFLDSDDEVLPDWLSRMALALENPAVGIVCCGYLDIPDEETGRSEKVFPNPRGPMYCNQKCLFRPPGTFALRRNLFNAAGGYTENLAYSENTELAMRVVPFCIDHGQKVVALDETLVVYHRRPSRQATTQDFIALFQSADFILERHGAKLREIFPPGYANYCGIAGVNAARLGKDSEARRFFASAISHYPFRLVNYGRLFLMLFPPIARRLWLRHR